jgi:tetratricopeptide (TPR) repeat protein
MVPDERYSLLLGILPETTIKWKQGSNEFYVRIDTMQTNSVSVAIQSGSVPGRSSEETLFDLGNFYSDCGDAQKAMDVADRLLSSNPESIDATILKADILLDLDKEPEAKQLYQMALEMFYRQFPASYEVPEYLLDMLRELEEIDRN